MELEENAVQVAANGSHLRITIRIAQRVLHKAIEIVAVNHVIRREDGDSAIDVTEGAKLIVPRIAQKKATRGSQKWLQEFASRHPELLNDTLRPRLQLDAEDTITWLSPLEEDKFAEYQDDAFLKRLSIRLDNRSLNSFWPRGGPVWDGLARTNRGDVICVEAKSHIQELSSSCHAGSQSLELIKRSLEETAEFYNATSPANWLHGYYQYANRLAYNYLLRHLNGIEAWLVFLYFTNDNKMAGPESPLDWKSAIDAIDTHLGINHTQLEPYIIEVFLDVTSIPGGNSGKKRA